MELFYWILEYVKVNIAYMLLMFVWPSIIFHRFLKGRSYTFRFMFCSVISIVLLNTSVILLGLVHLLNVHVFRILFYGSILLCIYFRIPNKKAKLIEAGRVLAGSYGVKQMFFNLSRNTIDAYHQSVNGLKKKILGRRLEYGLLSVVLIFGMIYFTYGSVQNHSYGFGDMYPHSAWVYGLVQGQIFSAGIYPEGMHCFIYAMHVLFGVRLFSCVLFTAGVHILILLLSVYIFFKELFRSRYTPIFALALFLTVDVLCIDEIYGMSRFQWTIPQEFGMFSVFICATALIRYCRSDGAESRIRTFLDKKGRNVEKLKKLIYNDELIIFSAALAVSVIVHFYDTGMAFFLCLAVVPVLIHRIFIPRRFVPLFASAITALVISVSPMALAFASGIPLQGSIGWAMSVINGDDWAEEGHYEQDTERPEDFSDDTERKNADETGDDHKNRSYIPAGNEHQIKASGYAKPAGIVITANGVVHKFVNGLYKGGYETLYRQERAKLIVCLTFIAFILFIVCKMINVIYAVKNKDRAISMCLFDGYFVLVLASIIFMMLYSADSIGLPSLFARSRLCGIERFFICAVCVIPIDLVFMFLEKKTPSWVAGVSGIVVTSVIYVGTIVTGNFHGYLYCEFTRYNSVVNVTESIVSNIDKQKFTIVSPVDELYQIIEYGYHEELVQFINDCVEKDYTLPTEYVFIFFEKRPLKYAQFNFSSGPAWLAEEKYMDYYDYKTGSQYPNYINSTASPEIATGPFYKFPVSSQSYNDWLTRTVLESRMLKWVNDFNDLYPNELHVYYEDDLFVCYYFRQNPACLYQLGFEADDSRVTTQSVIMGN